MPNSEEKMEDLKQKLEQIKGKPFTIKLSSGKKLRVAVSGIKNDSVVFKSVKKTKDGRVQLFGGFSFLFPLLFFLPFLFAVNNTDDLSDFDDLD